MSKARQLHERAVKLLTLQEGETEIDVKDIDDLKKYDPIDDDSVSEEDADPYELSEDEFSEMEKVEDKINSTLSDIGVTYSEVEQEEGEAEIDLAFENGDTVSARIFVEDGLAKLQLLGDSEQPISEVELVGDFVNDMGELDVNADNFPVDILKSEVEKVVKPSTEQDQPMESFYRVRDGIVESFQKKIKTDKRIFEKYKKLSEKKKAKKKAKK